MHKTVFVIGGSSGIGLAAINLLVEKGYVVYNGSRKPCPNPKVKNFQVDSKNTDTIKKAIDSILKIDKKIDILIYSSGFSMASEIENVNEADYKYLFDINLFGVIETFKMVIPIMKKNGGGKILCISSIGSTIPIAYDPYYSSSKAALDMFCYCTRLELEKDNIWTTSILPGGTRTGFSYKRKINNSTNENMAKAVASLYNIEQKGMSSEAVAKTIYRVVKKRKPPIKVASGIQNRIAVLLSKIFPQKFFLKILEMTYFKD